MRVADTGPGLPDDIRDEAFERFVRADQDRGIKGHGLRLLELLGCAPWNQPPNQPLQGENAALVEPLTEGDGELFIGLAFSGGRMRAMSFACGMLEELCIAGVETGTPSGLLDGARLVSGVSGGSVMAAHFGLYVPAGVPGFRERFLITDGETHMVTSGLNPLLIAKGVVGGVNGHARRCLMRRSRRKRR
ncbi:MAG: hypothetical protein C0524_00655 [Rhodobacter sp.]|nr:hypothetical protein [Rhodobacter sp.]